MANVTITTYAAQGATFALAIASVKTNLIALVTANTAPNTINLTAFDDGTGCNVIWQYTVPDSEYPQADGVTYDIAVTTDAIIDNATSAMDAILNSYVTAQDSIPQVIATATGYDTVNSVYYVICLVEYQAA